MHRDSVADDGGSAVMPVNAGNANKGWCHAERQSLEVNNCHSFLSTFSERQTQGTPQKPPAAPRRKENGSKSDPPTFVSFRFRSKRTLATLSSSRHD